MNEASARGPVTPPARWLREGWRILTLRTPRLDGLASSPPLVVGLLGLDYVMVFLIQRAMFGGHPTFDPRGIASGLIDAAPGLLMCWVVARSMRACAQPGIGVAALFTLRLAFLLVLTIVDGAVLLVIRIAAGGAEAWPQSLSMTLWGGATGWFLLAQLRWLWPMAAGRAARAAVPALLLVSIGAGVLLPAAFWWPERPAPRAVAASAGGAASTAHAAADDEGGYAGLPLTAALVDAQPRILADALDGLAPQRPGRVDVYAATYAPYASQDVFMHESAVVAKTMGERFGAAGRTVQLVVNPATSTRLPWATPENLHRTILRMAARMDRDEDVLFLHLTSHGGADAVLAADTWPLETDELTPAQLRAWLDEAGVRWRVISISACFSGSWIAPLAGDGALVMTAADADHTSYGCGSRSPLTFFGQAMYVDALAHTWSFEEAHAEARRLIDEREKAAGKTDGYSNPQLSEGEGIRARLRRLQAERAANRPPGTPR